ncbi:NAD-dependent epimerase/dehydratase family protein [Streptomyces mauvecolor]|uniref:NAD-dependent epimerase/dehydratase family protein n=1 Tax=Streptomyces mauvecolor TaxID=58345 RepID=A0ABV9UK34_9ACTN
MSVSSSRTTGDEHVGQAGSVVVLGATGFVGRHVCEAFEAAGWTVTGVARSTPSTPTPYAMEGLDVVGAEPGRIAELLARRGAEVVVNAAGAAWQVTEEEMARANTDLVHRLLAGLALLDGRPRLIQLGSVHEYGPVPNRTAITEDLPTAPVTPYGRSKLAGGRALLDAIAAGGATGLVLRLSNVSGPGTHRASLLGLVAHHLATSASQPLRLAPLLAHRDFVDVRDVAESVLAAARSDASGRVVNIGAGQATSVRVLVARLSELAGATAEIIEAPVQGGRPPETEYQRMDIGLAGALLGWAPRRSLDDSLRDLLVHARAAADREPLSSALQVTPTTMTTSGHR